MRRGAGAERRALDAGNHASKSYFLAAALLSAPDTMLTCEMRVSGVGRKDGTLRRNVQEDVRRRHKVWQNVPK